MSKTRTVSIKYTSREFDSIKQDLVDYAKRYYPDSFRDFNEASFGALMIDTVAYIGDILSFYIDYQANETFLETAAEYENILKLGKQLGFKFRGAASSVGNAAFYALVPATTTGVGPDQAYMPVLKKGSTFRATTGASFLLNQDVFFGNPRNEARVARVDETTGTPTFYAIKAYGEVVSGSLSQEFVTVGAFKKFNKVELQSLDISEIISVVDSEGNEFFEVDNLSQNVIYKSTTNRSKTVGTDSYDANTGDQAAEILKPVVVPRRFIVDRAARKTTLSFGSNSDAILPEDMISEPNTVIMETHGKNFIQDKSFDPTRLIASDKFGVAPSNTTLTVEFRSNTITNVNCRVGQLNKSVNYNVEFEDLPSLNATKANTVANSIEIDNEEPIVGDVSLPNSDELKVRIRDTFATQNRAVTQQDYESFVYQMPPKFGSVKRCRILRDNDSLRRNLNLYLISENRDGTLTESNSVLKKNVKTWLQKNKMISDTIDILDAKVINFSIEFVAVGRMDKSKFDVLESAKLKLQQRFSRLPDIGEPFFITDVYSELRKVEGILDVTDVKIVQKIGTTNPNRGYSNIRFDLDRATSADGRYIEMPKNVLYEVKFPAFDITGAIV
jgi:hypothetical protein